MKNQLIFIFSFFILFTIAFSACKEDKIAVPDISAINLQLDIQRFDQDLIAASKVEEKNPAQILRKSYPVFFDSVWMRIMLPRRVKGYDSAMVRAFSRQDVLIKLSDTVTQKYPQTGQKWQIDLEKAFRYAKHYLPQVRTPRVVTYMSEMSLGDLTYDQDTSTILGIGLDFFLGADFIGYDPKIFPQYIRRSMNKQHLVAWALDAWLNNLLGENTEDKMIDQMIYHGKLLYMKRRLIPFEPDSIQLGFSPKQLQWLTANERLIWQHYLDEELLYESKPARIAKHIGPSPNAPGMPPEAPGGNAKWMGLQIVEQYMKRYPLTTWDQLINNKNAQKILNDSKYKPKR